MDGYEFARAVRADRALAATAWIRKENPAGVYSDCNPDVSCQ
jgi:hypothetical protein